MYIDVSQHSNNLLCWMLSILIFVVGVFEGVMVIIGHMPVSYLNRQVVNLYSSK